LPGLERVSYARDCGAFNHATEARIYPEEPDWAIVTRRGWVRCDNITTSNNNVECPSETQAGITIVNVSGPSNPFPIQVWNSPNGDAVEGQDRLNSLLVVCTIDQGGIYAFNISSSSDGSKSPLELISYTASQMLVQRCTSS